MTETREIYDPFHGKTVSIRNDLVLRLRGKYANGPTLPNGEPEFGWREFPTLPIQKEAADKIERLLAAIQTIADFPITNPNENMDAFNMQKIAREQL